jgi:hypothetical protein
MKYFPQNNTGRVGENTRNHANSAKCSLGKYGHKPLTVEGAKGNATQTLHGAFLSAPAHSFR